MKLTLKQIGRLSGYTQIELAQMAGVSDRTVRRFEAGTSHNKALEALYEKLEPRAEKVQKIKEKAAIAKTRYKKIKNYIAKNEGKDKSAWATNYFEGDMGGYEGLDPKGKGDNELDRILARLDKYLNAKTTTVEGYKKWKKNITEATKKTSGEATNEANKGYWELFQLIRKNADMWQWIKLIVGGRKTLSEQIEEYISDCRANKWTFEEIENSVKIKMDIREFYPQDEIEELQ